MVNIDKLQQVLSDFLPYVKSGTLSLESKYFLFWYICCGEFSHVNAGRNSESLEIKQSLGVLVFACNTSIRLCVLVKMFIIVKCQGPRAVSVLDGNKGMPQKLAVFL